MTDWIFYGGFLVVFLLILLFILSITFLGELYGAPFAPSKKGRIRQMIEMADIHKGDRVVDLGSGDASILIFCAQKGAKAFGIEINPFLVLYSKIKIRCFNLQDSIEIYWGNFHDFDLKKYDIVFIYLLPKTVYGLQDKLIKELNPKARIISNGIELPEFHNISSKNGIFMYSKISFSKTKKSSD